MRITGGSHRGRRLVVPEGREVRPTADRARQALFNILEHGACAAAGSPMHGARVLDAFAGTGALGLEALSRGAAQVTFFESAPAALAALRANIAELDETARTTVQRVDATAPPLAPAACTLAFLDPPYGKGLAAPTLAALAARGWLEAGALVVVETGAGETFVAPPGFAMLDQRSYGAARLAFLRFG